jgi:hypothetical protein
MGAIVRFNMGWNNEFYNEMLNKHKNIQVFIIMEILKKIDYIIDNYENKSIKHGIYIYGNNGIGKTTYIKELLKEKYDCIWYTAMDKITKLTIENLTNNNIANNSIMTSFNRIKKNNVIIIDDIENIHYTDKNILNLLVKLIRPKKTKKQLVESYSLNPIIFIANKIKDKKINDLIAVTVPIEMKDKSTEFCRKIILAQFPQINNKYMNSILKISNNNLSKLTEILHLYKHNVLICGNLNYVSNNNTKDITRNILLNDCKLQNFNSMISEGDRTIISLLYHENSSTIIDTLPTTKKILLYSKILDNMCICDYIDRFIFQKQLWELNELSNIIKIFYNNLLLRKTTHVDTIKDITFTKVLTKYSSEYNNYVFCVKLCKLLSCNKKDIYIIIKESNKLFNRLHKLYHDSSELDSARCL